MTDNKDSDRLDLEEYKKASNCLVFAVPDEAVHKDVKDKFDKLIEEVERFRSRRSLVVKEITETYDGHLKREIESLTKERDDILKERDEFKDKLESYWVYKEIGRWKDKVEKLEIENAELKKKLDWAERQRDGKMRLYNNLLNPSAYMERERTKGDEDGTFHYESPNYIPLRKALQRDNALFKKDNQDLKAQLEASEKKVSDEELKALRNCRDAALKINDIQGKVNSQRAKEIADTILYAQECMKLQEEQ